MALVTVHRVATGDTLASIAADYGTTAADIFAANRGVLGSNVNKALVPGTLLEMPLQAVADLGATVGEANNAASATLMATKAEHDETRARLNALLDKLRDAQTIS